MRLGRTTIALLALLLAACIPAQAATYHVDAIAGNDATGDGSDAAPLASLAKVRPLLEGGDTVVLYDGDYGSIEEVRSGVVDLYDDWVTYRAAPDASPTVEHIYFGYNAGSYIGPQDQTGAYDVYLRFEGLHIKDGLASYGARHWALVNCRVERYGPWTGSVANIEKTAVFWRGGTDIRIEDCEITRTGTAIAGRGHDVDILGNHIHGGTHDGLRVMGFWNALIDGNVIHDFDDGVTDAEASWSRHCDGIHIFVPGPETPGWQNHNVIFRNNIVYDCEAQIVQFNNYGSVRNEMIVFENNVFGPGNAPMFNNADPCDTLIFRHNSVITTPGGRVFNRWTCDNYTLRISGESTDVEIYNNILGSIRIEVGADVQVFDWNLIQIPGTPVGVGNSRAYGRFTLIGDDPRFLAPADMDYRTTGDSPAINAGTRLFAPDLLYEWDYENTLRDNRPDLGVYEFPGLTPDAEEPLEDSPDPKTVFVDDFEDGHDTNVNALTILAWEIFENHGSAGDLATPAADHHVAATLDGIRRLRVTFSEAVDPATVSNGVVSIVGTLSGSLSAMVSSVVLDAADSRMTITLSGSLPDEDRYVVTIAASVTTPEGVALSGDRDRVLSALAGDTGGSGTVSSSDIAAIRAMVGSAVNSTTGRFDVDLSGVITAVDMLAVRALRGHTLP